MSGVRNAAQLPEEGTRGSLIGLNTVVLTSCADDNLEPRGLNTSQTTIDTGDQATLRRFLGAHGFAPSNLKVAGWPPQPWRQTAKQIHEQCQDSSDHSEAAIIRVAKEFVTHNMLTYKGSHFDTIKLLDAASYETIGEAESSAPLRTQSISIASSSVGGCSTSGSQDSQVVM